MTKKELKTKYAEENAMFLIDHSEQPQKYDYPYIVRYALIIWVLFMTFYIL